MVCNNALCRLRLQLTTIDGELTVAEGRRLTGLVGVSSMISSDDGVGTGVGVGEDADIDIVSHVDSDTVTIIDDGCNRN